MTAKRAWLADWRAKYRPWTKLFGLGDVAEWLERWPANRGRLGSKPRGGWKIKYFNTSCRKDWRGWEAAKIIQFDRRLASGHQVWFSYFFFDNRRYKQYSTFWNEGNDAVGLLSFIFLWLLCLLCLTEDAVQSAPVAWNGHKGNRPTCKT